MKDDERDNSVRNGGEFESLEDMARRHEGALASFGEFLNNQSSYPRNTLIPQIIEKLIRITLRYRSCLKLEFESLFESI